MLKYRFCKKSLRKDEPLTSSTLFFSLCDFGVPLVLQVPQSEEKSDNWSEVHLSELRSY